MAHATPSLENYAVFGFFQNNLFTTPALIGGLSFFSVEQLDLNPSKCGADERRRRGLDRAEHVFLPLGAKMQIESYIVHHT